jgi:hypothetical protein
MKECELHENVQRLRPKLWRQKNWLLHHNNAPSHTSFITRVFLAENDMIVIPTYPALLTWPPVTEGPPF